MKNLVFRDRLEVGIRPPTFPVLQRKKFVAPLQLRFATIIATNGVDRGGRRARVLVLDSNRFAPARLLYRGTGGSIDRLSRVGAADCTELIPAPGCLRVDATFSPVAASSGAVFCSRECQHVRF